MATYPFTQLVVSSLQEATHMLLKLGPASTYMTSSTCISPASHGCLLVAPWGIHHLIVQREIITERNIRCRVRKSRITAYDITKVQINSLKVQLSYCVRTRFPIFVRFSIENQYHIADI